MLKLHKRCISENEVSWSVTVSSVSILGNILMCLPNPKHSAMGIHAQKLNKRSNRQASHCVAIRNRARGPQCEAAHLGPHSKAGQHRSPYRRCSGQVTPGFTPQPSGAAKTPRPNSDSAQCSVRKIRAVEPRTHICSAFRV